MTNSRTIAFRASHEVCEQLTELAKVNATTVGALVRTMVETELAHLEQPAQDGV